MARRRTARRRVPYRRKETGKAAKKAPAKKAAAKKTPAKKAAAKKTAAKKTAAKKAPRRRLPARRPARPRGDGSERRPRGLDGYDITGDALVLASVSSPAELDLLNDWVSRQRRDHPDADIEVLQLPGEDEPPAGTHCATGRGARSRWRGSIRRSGAGVLGAGRTAHPGEDRRPAVGPRNLPSAGTHSAPHPAQGPGPRAGGRRRTGQSVGVAAAVAGAHDRGKPQGVRTFRHFAGRAWRSNGSNCGCSGRNTSPRA